ncbi:hypothetical protein JW935_02815 [candidate division KSB1 bacterium]|nr:hypothetical protein [candidate division KSB1 bacterium]
MSVLIPVGVSNRHMHLTREVLDTLFGRGIELEVYRYLRQRGEFASKQTVEMIGPRNRFSAVRILGPLRDRMQVEVSRSDAVFLGIFPPMGKFASLPDGESLELKGPNGSIKIAENIMVSRRHLHLNQADADEIGVRDQDSVYVAPVKMTADPAESRICIMGNVLVRVQENFIKELHLDTDEGNACGLRSGDMVYVVPSSIGYYAEMPSKKLVTEHDVRQAVLRKQKIRLLKGTIITPAAKDLAKSYNIFVE